MIEWAEMKFPPINLWNVWPSKEMSEFYKVLEECDDSY
jgi:hypothetical protein